MSLGAQRVRVVNGPRDMSKVKLTTWREEARFCQIVRCEWCKAQSFFSDLELSYFTSPQLTHKCRPTI